MPMLVLGMDIAKAKFCTYLLRADGTAFRKTFPNTPAGCEHLSSWLQNLPPDRVHACVDAIGMYGAAVALWLHEQGHVVSLAAIKAYAVSQLTRSTPDRIDDA